jgi:hypothetical protein
MSGDATLRDEGLRHVLVVQGTDLLERVRERVMPDVVQQRRGSNYGLIRLADRDRAVRLAKERQGPARKMVGAERMLEA